MRAVHLSLKIKLLVFFMNKYQIYVFHLQKRDQEQDESMKQERARYKAWREGDKKHQSHGGYGALPMHTDTQTYTVVPYQVE